ncbi:Piwi-domain-containing protein [Daedalea quercina L-15889]|uniref:Piwi-domain-containing protein n=1 Tax=Daedalea quercina L-15889 TaxID=1314783 RepID=A0A165MCY2_9APHY|nr:Piwi-domain-containing protein [Daedalea quercina L-15889]
MSDNNVYRGSPNWAHRGAQRGRGRGRGTQPSTFAAPSPTSASAPVSSSQREGPRVGGSPMSPRTGPTGGGFPTQRGGQPSGDYHSRGHQRGHASATPGGSFTPPSARGRGVFNSGGFVPRSRGRGGQPDASQLFAADDPAIADARLASHNDLLEGFAAIKSGPELPLPPPSGTLGTDILLRTNLLPTNFDVKTYFDYELKLQPAKGLVAERKAQALSLLEAHSDFAPFVGQVAHDGSQRLISVAKLPDPFAIIVQLNGQGDRGAQNVSIEFILKHELEMDVMRRYADGDAACRGVDIQPYISALQLVSQQHARKMGVRIGRDSQTRFFFRSLTERSPILLGGGLEAWRGFFTSIRPTYSQVMTNINPGIAPFYVPGNLAEAMLASIEENRGVVHPDFGRKLKVKTTYQGSEKTWTIQRVLDTTALWTSFPSQDMGGKVTVADYFARKYPNYPLQHVNDVPLVCVQTKPSPIHLPAELCEIPPNQPYFGQLTKSATTIVLNHANNPPKVNAEMIMNEGFQYLGLGEDTDTPAMDAFGVRVEKKMAVVPGRILPPPTPRYLSADAPSFTPGSWNFAKMKFQRGATVPSWTVLLLLQGRQGKFKGASDPELKLFLDKFVEQCQSSGMKFTATTPPILEAHLPFNDDRYRTSAIQVIRTSLAGHVRSTAQPPKLVLVLLADEDSRIYCGLKRICDMELGVHTVGMQPDKATKPKGQGMYFGNVALKVNMKLGGMNHVLDAASTKWLRDSMLKNTMLVGIDVTHGSTGSKAGSPSLAAIVASVDSDFTNYPAELRIQRPAENKESKEVVADLKDMVVGRLRLYKRKNGRLPAQLIVYRDGVGESQFRQTILDRELPSIKAAFEEMSEPSPGRAAYTPKLSIIVCVKRHHTRFYPTETQHMSSNGNTLPGTVVDKGVSDAFLFEFYLQGTVKPTRYVVIYDDIGFTSDVLQQGTHMLCYLYPRATKAVSYVPPAYLADLACERARCWLDTIMNTGDQLTDVSSDQGKGKRKKATEEEKAQVLDEAIKMWGNGVHQNLAESMFYI